MYPQDNARHCPHCDGVTFSADPCDCVTITEDGVQVEAFECLTCGGRDLYPSDLIPAHVVQMGS